MDTIEELKKELILRKSGAIFTNPFVFDLYKSSVDIVNNDNKLAFNFFCLGIRECLEKTLKDNDEDIKKCVWFNHAYSRANENDNLITTKARLYYLFAGGLKPEWFENFNEIDDMISHVYSLYNKLSKLTHLNEIVEANKKQQRVNEVLSTLTLLGKEISKTKTMFESNLAEILSENIGEYINNNLINEIDEICTHYYEPSENVEELVILDITDEAIIVLVEGTIEVTTQWGSDRDVRNDDGDISQMAQPFSITLRVEIDIQQQGISNFNNIEVIEPLKIDNSSFYE